MSYQRGGLLAVLAVAAMAVLGYRQYVFKEPALAAKPKLVIVTGGDGSYWQLIASGAEAAAEDLGAQVDVRMPESAEDLEAQLQILLSLDTSTTNGIALSPIDAESQTRVIDRLSESMIVVTLDSDAPLSSRLSYVGASNFAAGLESGQLITDALPDGGKIAVLMANMSKDNLQERKNGFDDVVLRSESESDLPDAKEPEVQYDIVGYFRR